MFVAAFFMACQPVVDTEWFDPLALPTVTLEDLDRFHDAKLAIDHNASPEAIEKWLERLKSCWWDTAGFRSEYEAEVRHTQRVRECWNQLNRAHSHLPEWHRTEALEQLRRLLGPQAYYAGRMPAIPVEAMQWMVPKPKQ